ncbi:MAG TPA: hypothetical protein VKR42_04705 [Ktedonobacteraceae bacterium]|nr:hypothetical protein [Ktedonobacteraceae bacterium]
MQRQQQQQADYDLLAVFNDETKAEVAETKLLTGGFSSEEVFRLTADVVRDAQFREHGQKSDHSAVFLQTTRSGPNPVTVVLLAILFGVVLGLLTLAAHFAFSAIPELTGTLVGVVVGIIIGAVIGLLRRGPVRGNIGQDVTRISAASTLKKPAQDARTVVALRFPDPDNITRKSRARAILLNNGGKIDRSVGRE